MKKLWIVVGQNTLSVVVLHFLCFKLVSLIEVLIYHEPFYFIAAFPILHNNGLWWLAYLIVGLCIPIGLNIIYKNIIKLLKEKIFIKQKNSNI